MGGKGAIGEMVSVRRVEGAEGGLREGVGGFVEQVPGRAAIRGLVIIIRNG